VDKTYSLIQVMIKVSKVELQLTVCRPLYRGQFVSYFCCLTKIICGCVSSSVYMLLYVSV